MRNLLALPLLLAATPALAASWAVDPAQSTLTFEGTQGTDSFHGGFRKFTADIAYDAAKPKSGHVAVTVDTTSVYADGKEQQEALPTSNWLDTKTFPTAVFDGDFSQAGSDGKSFTANGTLNLHGIKQPMPLSFTLNPQGKSMLATGRGVLMRNNYKIGQGEWASDRWIAYPITVSFTLLAIPQ